MSLKIVYNRVILLLKRNYSMDFMQNLKNQVKLNAQRVVDPLSEAGKNLVAQKEAERRKQQDSVVAHSEAQVENFRQATTQIQGEIAESQNTIDSINAERSAQIQALGLQSFQISQANKDLIHSELGTIKENMTALGQGSGITKEALQATLADIDSVVADLATLKNHEAKKMLKDLSQDPEAKGQATFIKNATQDIASKSGTNAIKEANAKAEAEANEPKVVPKLLTRTNVAPLEKNLKQRVFGQDEVIEEVVTVLKSALVNLKVNKKKPAGSYFFAGPSGVGKTELARTMADSLGVPLLVINMGEYTLEHEVAKLLGAPPGYQGSEEPGLIPRFIEKNPNGIILFDEVEKAHENADNILLSIMDQGVCQDNKGQDVHFKETIIIATSNLGAKVEYYDHLTQEEKNKYRMEAIKQRIRPEIIGRYDAIFHFHSLNQDVYMQIVDKFLKGIAQSAKEEHGMELKFSDAMREMIAKKSYDPALGGRPAGKFIEKVSVPMLADFLLRDDFEEKIAANPVITVDVNAAGNVYFHGANGEVLGELTDTAKIVERLDKARFSERKEMDSGQADVAIEPPANPIKTPRVKLPRPATAPVAAAEKASVDEIKETVAPTPRRKPRTR